MVFQQPNPFPMSIFDNVAFALREQSRRRPRRRELEPLVKQALQRAGLYEEVRDDLDRPALRLSGGQQQRLCIARAIATEPEILLMDEPCSALDPRSTAVIEDLILQLRSELAIVIVTHNLQQARRIADRVAFMYLGDLVELATRSSCSRRRARSARASTSPAPSDDRARPRRSRPPWRSPSLRAAARPRRSSVPRSAASSATRRAIARHHTARRREPRRARHAHGAVQLRQARAPSRSS